MVWFAAPTGLLILGMGGVALVTTLSIWTIVGTVMGGGLAGYLLASTAYVLIGHMDVKKTENEWLVATVLGPFRSTRRFPRSAVRVARKFHGLWDGTPGASGPQIELDIDRARPVRIGGGFYLGWPQLQAIAQVFSVDLIDSVDGIDRVQDFAGATERVVDQVDDVGVDRAGIALELERLRDRSRLFFLLFAERAH